MYPANPWVIMRSIFRKNIEFITIISEKKYPDCQLLFTDTDSLFYHIKTEKFTKTFG